MVSWALRPDSLIVNTQDGSYWTAGHPGYFDINGGWCLWSLKRAKIGWWVDKSDVWAFDVWPDEAKVLRSVN